MEIPGQWRKEDIRMSTDENKVIAHRYYEVDHYPFRGSNANRRGKTFRDRLAVMAAAVLILLAPGCEEGVAEQQGDAEAPPTTDAGAPRTAPHDYRSHKDLRRR